MYTIELYIEGKRVDLFQDESVKLTDSIQNVRDIDKVFTAFSQTFSLPASKVNNQIFKHYYDFSIDNGFDARKKVNAAIELNTLPFRTGKIKLEGVDLKDRKAHTYRVTFFGDIVVLKDKLGQDKLSDIDFSGYDVDYSSSLVIQKFSQINISDSMNLVVPLITHSQRVYYDSGPTANVPDSGNLHYTSNTHGVKWNELKYALRVNTIIQQLEIQYDLQFSTDFFRNVNVKEMHGMFLWLHRKSGKVEDLSGADIVTTLVDFIAVTYDGLFEIYQTTFCSYYTTSQISLLRLLVSPASGYYSTVYGIRIEENGVIVYNSGLTLTGTTSLSAGTDWVYYGGCYQVFVETNVDMQFSGAQWQGRGTANGYQANVAYNSGAFSATDVFKFNVSKQMPDIKILDFLTGLFKIFNLTAFVDTAGVIVVQPLDEFYANGIGHALGSKGTDITQYVDISSSQVNVALPFKEIYFKFEDTATFLANKFGEITGRPWGQISYSGNAKLDGGLYEIKAPFGHLLYERLSDSDGSIQPIQVGYNVNNDQSSYLGKPLLFYPIRVSVAGVEEGGIAVVDEVDDNNVAVSRVKRSNVIMPFNSVSLDPSVNNFQLNFFEETSEWTRNENGQIFTGNLFNKYYKNYIESVFNPKQRLTKVSAYLPMSFLLNYKLSDRLVIGDKQYKINSISTNLQSGKSDLELITDRIITVPESP
tara:strand:- start:2152 stop:4254 length:2103 start_codon:yes stop_codon:yes gene_type:complete